MPRSKLEVHADILEILANCEPLKLTHIMYETNVNYNVLKQYLGFLIKHNLVVEKTLPKKKTNRILYAITERGLVALKYFRQMNSALQIAEEAYRVPMPRK